MIPVNNLISTKLEFVTQPSRDFKIDMLNNRIGGMITDLDAVRQAVFMILNTERYNTVIHSWNYGMELKGLYGKRMGYVQLELTRRIKEALTQDERIIDVTDFVFTYPMKDIIKVEFDVLTVHGLLKESSEVNI